MYVIEVNWRVYRKVGPRRCFGLGLAGSRGQKPLATGTQNVIWLEGNKPELVLEVEQYWLEIAGHRVIACP